jgi:hypothetical protein
VDLERRVQPKRPALLWIAGQTRDCVERGETSTSALEKKKKFFFFVFFFFFSLFLPSDI